MHLRGLANNGKVDGWQQRKHALQAVLARVLLLGRCGKDDVVLHPLLMVEVGEGCCQRHQASTGIVAAQAEELIALHHWLERVAGVARVGAHRVEVRVEQHGGLLGIEILVNRPNIIQVTLRFYAARGEVVVHQIGYLSLLAAERLGRDEQLQQLDGTV